MSRQKQPVYSALPGTNGCWHPENCCAVWWWQKLTIEGGGQTYKITTKLEPSLEMLNSQLVVFRNGQNDKRNHFEPQDGNLLVAGKLERQNDNKKVLKATQKRSWNQLVNWICSYSRWQCCSGFAAEGHDSEEEVQSQQAVDGSLASLHCWLADFEDTPGVYGGLHRQGTWEDDGNKKKIMSWPEMAVLPQCWLRLGRMRGMERMGASQGGNGE